MAAILRRSAASSTAPVHALDCRPAQCRAARRLRSRSRSCAMLSAAITAMRSAPAILPALADLAHPAIEERDRVDELGALGLLARDLVVAAEQRDVERDRALAARCGGLGVVIRRPRASARAARRAARVASATRCGRACWLRAFAAARSRRSASLAARSARVCAISDASLRSSAASSASMAASAAFGVGNRRMSSRSL